MIRFRPNLVDLAPILFVRLDHWSCRAYIATVTWAYIPKILLCQCRVHLGLRTEVCCHVVVSELGTCVLFGGTRNPRLETRGSREQGLLESLERVLSH